MQGSTQSIFRSQVVKETNILKGDHYSSSLNIIIDIIIEINLHTIPQSPPAWQHFLSRQKSTFFSQPEMLAPASQYQYHRCGSKIFGRVISLRASSFYIEWFWLCLYRALEFAAVNPGLWGRKYRFAYGLGFPTGYLVTLVVHSFWDATCSSNDTSNISLFWEWFAKERFLLA